MSSAFRIIISEQYVLTTQVASVEQLIETLIPRIALAHFHNMTVDKFVNTLTSTGFFKFEGNVHPIMDVEVVIPVSENASGLAKYLYNNKILVIYYKNYQITTDFNKKMTSIIRITDLGYNFYYFTFNNVTQYLEKIKVYFRHKVNETNQDATYTKQSSPTKEVAESQPSSKPLVNINVRSANNQAKSVLDNPIVNLKHTIQPLTEIQESSD